MSTVTAYVATSATEPLTKTTITRRDPGPHDVAIDIKFAGICHSDIHTVKSEWGVPNYPLVRRPRDRRRGDRRRLRGDQAQGRRSRRRGLHGEFLRRVPQLQGRARAVLQAGRDLHLQLHRQRRHAHLWRLQPGHRRRRELRRAHPRRAAAGQSGAAAVRGHHAVLTAAALEGRAGHAAGHHRPGRPRPHGRQAGRGDGRRGDACSRSR